VGNDAVNLFLIEPSVIYRTNIACKCQSTDMADDTWRTFVRHLSYVDDRSLFVVVAHGSIEDSLSNTGYTLLLLSNHVNRFDISIARLRAA